MKPDTPFPDFDAARFALEEKVKVGLALERELAAEGRIPNTRKLLMARLSGVYGFLGGVILGLWVAYLAVTFAFFVFVKMLHLGS